MPAASVAAPFMLQYQVYFLPFPHSGPGGRTERTRTIEEEARDLEDVQHCFTEVRRKKRSQDFLLGVKEKGQVKQVSRVMFHCRHLMPKTNN
jgi:hypothetical protein